jgi:Protein of unknown function (DUF3126)
MPRRVESLSRPSGREARYHDESQVEVYAGREFLGTLYRDEEDGEVSYSLHITILEGDLPTQLG